jgi:hexosaminidase
MCIFLLCLIVIPLPPGKNPFAVQLNNINNLLLICFQVICPTHNSTFDLLTAMIDQVVALHSDIKYLHIGCDEVYYLGECVRCGLTMVDHQWSKKQLFLHHVSRLAK